jgi:hypothetical protein
MDRTRKKGLGFGLMVVVVLYILVSISIAIATVDHCGDESSSKSWAQFPTPHWDCSRPGYQTR